MRDWHLSGKTGAFEESRADKHAPDQAAGDRPSAAPSGEESPCAPAIPDSLLQDVPQIAELDTAEKSCLLRLARESICDLVRGTSRARLDATPGLLGEKRACFVTLFRRGTLRGCIGNVNASMPLYRAVLENARAAASRDPRFPAVEADELEDLNIEISVLTEPKPLTFDSIQNLLAQLQPGISGVLLQIGGRLGTFLPQVWTQIPDRTDFLNRLSEKTGLPSGAWRGPGVSVFVYRVQSFAEENKLAHN